MSADKVGIVLKKLVFWTFIENGYKDFIIDKHKKEHCGRSSNGI